MKRLNPTPPNRSVRSDFHQNGFLEAFDSGLRLQPNEYGFQEPLKMQRYKTQPNFCRDGNGF